MFLGLELHKLGQTLFAFAADGIDSSKYKQFTHLSNFVDTFLQLLR